MAHVIQVIRRSYILKTVYRLSCSVTNNASEIIDGKLKAHYGNDDIKKKLADMGFSENCAKVINENLESTSFNESKVNVTLEILKKYQFSSDLIINLIETHPLLLFTDPRTLHRTCSKLLELFTKKYVYSILLKSPEILNEEWHVTHDKLKYLQEEMCVSNLDIVSYGVLKHPLKHIKLRHELLKRTGKYKSVHPKLSSFEKHKLNPLIDNILNSSSADFSIKVAGISELEFQIFEQLYIDTELE